MATNEPIRVMVVDDHPVVRDGIRQVLQHFEEFDVVGQAGDGEEAVRLAVDSTPEVIIMDVIMPVKDGVDACREIIDLLPDTRVLMLTASSAPDAVVEAIAAGASGYLLKDSGVDHLVTVVREVAKGRINLTADVLRRAAMMIRKGTSAQRSRGPESLTARELETLRYFCQGLPYVRIAEIHGISRSTVRNTIDRIQDKMGVGSKPEMVIWAVRAGLLDELDPNP